MTELHKISIPIYKDALFIFFGSKKDCQQALILKRTEFISYGCLKYQRRLHTMESLCMRYSTLCIDSLQREDW